MFSRVAPRLASALRASPLRTATRSMSSAAVWVRRGHSEPTNKPSSVYLFLSASQK